MAEKVEIIAELKDLVSGKFAEINKQIEGMGSKLSNILGKGGIMGQVVGANLLSGAIMRAGSAVTDFAKESFRAYGEAEQFQVALTTLLYGNADAANALNNQLKQFALQTPFELTELQQATKLMIAYGSTAGNVVDELRVLGDVAAGTAQPVGELAYLYGTVRTHGQATLIDLRQFANRGIPIYKELAKVTKYTSDQIVEGGKDINISFQDVEKAFKNMTAAGSQYGGMMAEQAKTMLGQASNLSDAWKQLEVEIGKSQDNILKNTIGWATEMVNTVTKVVEGANYFSEIQDKIGNKVKQTKWYDPRTWLDGGEKVDERAMFNVRGRVETAQSSEREKSLRNLGYTEVGTADTETRLIEFQERFLDQFKKVSADPSKVNIASLNADIARERLRIDKEQINKTISRELASSEWATLNDIAKKIEGVKMLKGEKDAANAKADKTTETPKELEHVAKGNRPTQIIVNIDNLVNELTNNISSARDAKQMTAEEVSKALLSAVNDVYAVGQ